MKRSRWLLSLASAIALGGAALGVGFAAASPAKVDAVATFTDTITAANLSADGSSYTEFSYTSGNSVDYVGSSAKNGDNIQLKSKNSICGFITTNTMGTIKQVDVVWPSGSGNVLDIYGSNTAYTGTNASALYATGTQGTKLGSITQGTSTQLEVTDEYAYVGARSKSGAIYLTSIAFTWNAASTDVVSALAVTPTTKSCYVGDVIASADYALTATVNSVAGVAYTNYRAEVGSGTSASFTKREEVVFGTTALESTDTVLRFYAKDKNASSGYEYADVSLTVSVPTLTALTISDATATIVTGKTKKLSVTGTPSGADATVTWSSDNATVASVDASTGLVTAGSTKGTATITATSTTAPTVKATCEVTVIDPITYNLVTSLDQLTSGSKIVVSSLYESAYYAMSSTQNANNRGTTSATFASDVLTPESDVEVLEVGVVSGGYTLKTLSGGYLYTNSIGSNRLFTDTAVNEYTTWKITLESGAFAVKNVKNTGRGLLSFNENSGSPIYACYSSEQTAAVSLYILPGVADTAAHFANDFLCQFTCDNGVTAPSTSVWATYKTRYVALSSTEADLLKNATANAGGTDIEKCMARYDYVVARYSVGSYENYIGRSITPIGGAGIFEEIGAKSNDMLIIAFASLGVAALAVGAYFLLRKKKHA